MTTLLTTKNFKLVNRDNIKTIVQPQAGVYVLFCLNNRQFYVGQSINIYNRIHTHLYSQRRNKNGGSFEIGTLVKQAHYRFAVQTFYIAEPKRRDDIERQLITHFGVHYALFNRQMGNHGSLPKHRLQPNSNIKLSTPHPRKLSKTSADETRVFLRHFRFNNQDYALSNSAIAHLFGIKYKYLSKLLYERKLSIQEIANQYSADSSKQAQHASYCFYDGKQQQCLSFSKLSQTLHMHRTTLRRQLDSGMSVQKIVDMQLAKLARTGTKGSRQCLVLVDNREVLLSVTETANKLNISRYIIYHAMAKNQLVDGVIAYRQNTD